jgi:hypothetical protein
MSAEEKAEVADSLREGAEAMKAARPALAARFEKIADALQKGDVPGAQAAMVEAADGIGQMAAAAGAQPGGGAAGGMPPGHPGGSGHGGGMPSGMFQPPEDTVEEDPTAPPGTVSVDVRDADDKPLPRERVTLAVNQQSIAKGDNASSVVRAADENGHLRFDGLQTGSNVSYRVKVLKGDALFAASPFQLAQSKAMKVVLHVYPATHDLQEATIVMEGFAFLEMKDDRLQVEQLFQVYNFGKTAWVPGPDVVLPLPDGYTALRGQEDMGDAGIDTSDKRGPRLRGTFAPGKHTIAYRWQLPWGGEKDVSFSAALPPHLAAMHVTAAASGDIKLHVDGFPEPHPDHDGRGQAVLQTEKTARREDPPMTALKVSLRELPTPGPARVVATLVAAFGVLTGLAFAFVGARGGRRKTGDAKAARQQWLEELEDLERAREAGEVGPQTYERTRREILDAIARTLVAAGPGPTR